MSGDPLMLANMQEQLAQKEAKEQQLTAEWNEKWREAAKVMFENMCYISRCTAKSRSVFPLLSYNQVWPSALLRCFGHGVCSVEHHEFYIFAIIITMIPLHFQFSIKKIYTYFVSPLSSRPPSPFSQTHAHIHTNTDTHL